MLHLSLRIIRRSLTTRKFNGPDFVTRLSNSSAGVHFALMASHASRISSGDGR
jgi:hypothetical protein